MLPFEDRYSRQRRLPEVGAQGQERLLALDCVLVDDASGRIAAEYLRRAGATVHLGSAESAAPTAPCPHLGTFHDRSARDIAEGSWIALTHIRRQLGLTAERRHP